MSISRRNVIAGIAGDVWAERQRQDQPRFGLTHNLGGFPQRNVAAISIVGKYGA
jgi:hypothetical protein